MRSLLLLTVALIWPSDVDAQSPAERNPRPVFIGSVRDSATGRPVARVNACTEMIDGQPPGYVRHCVHADTLGRFMLTDLQFGNQKLLVSCYGVRSLDGQLFLAETVHITTPDTIVRHLVVDAQKRRGTYAGCDMRPFRQERVTVNGHWTAGFELNHFTPCGDTISGWANIPQSVAAATKWPGAKGPVSERTFFVRFEGVIRGPGQYGHMGVSAWEMDVERVHWAKARGKC